MSGKNLILKNQVYARLTVACICQLLVILQSCQTAFFQICNSQVRRAVLRGVDMHSKFYYKFFRVNHRMWYTK